MRRQWSTLVVLAGSLVFLASLYLPWSEACPSTQPGASSLLCGQAIGLGDWHFNGVGRAAALVALLLAVCAAVRIVSKPAPDLPVSFLAVLMGYLAVAVAAQTQTRPYSPSRAKTAIHVHFAYGAYLGLAAALVVVIATLAPHRRAIASHRSVAHLVGVAFVAALLGTLLSPWWHFQDYSGNSWTTLGVADPATTVAAALVVCLPIVWWRRGAAAPFVALLLAAAGALFTIGAVSPFRSSLATTAWVAIGFAAALVGLTGLELLRARTLSRPSWRVSATAGAAAFVVTGLFLPWQGACYGVDKSLGADSGRCVTTNGWSAAGVVVAVLAIASVIAAMAPQRIRASRVELALASALFFATLRFELMDGRFFLSRYSVGSGATVSLVGVALLAVLALVRVRLPRLEWRRVPARIAPIAVCVAYIAIVVPWWINILPARHLTGDIPLSWLTVAGALVGIHLLVLWIRRIANAGESAPWLVFVPLFLLALAAIDLIERRATWEIRWDSIIAGICLLLAFFGYAERRGGVRKLRLPEVLRVDRISEP